MQNFNGSLVIQGEASSSASKKKNKFYLFPLFAILSACGASTSTGIPSFTTNPQGVVVPAGGSSATPPTSPGETPNLSPTATPVTAPTPLGDASISLTAINPTTLAVSSVPSTGTHRVTLSDFMTPGQLITNYPKSLSSYSFVTASSGKTIFNLQPSAWSSTELDFAQAIALPPGSSKIILSLSAPLKNGHLYLPNLILQSSGSTLTPTVTPVQCSPSSGEICTTASDYSVTLDPTATYSITGFSFNAQPTTGLDGRISVLFMGLQAETQSALTYFNLNAENLPSLTLNASLSIDPLSSDNIIVKTAVYPYLKEQLVVTSNGNLATTDFATATATSSADWKPEISRFKGCLAFPTPPKS